MRFPARRFAVGIPVPADALSAAALIVITVFSIVARISFPTRALSCWSPTPAAPRVSVNDNIIRLRHIERTIRLIMDATSPSSFIKSTCSPYVSIISNDKKKHFTKNESVLLSVNDKFPKFHVRSLS